MCRGPLASREGPRSLRGADLQDPSHLHQRDQLGCDAVAQTLGQLGQQGLERPELLKLLGHRVEITKYTMD